MATIKTSAARDEVEYEARVTPGEAAAITGLSTDVLERMATAGKLSERRTLGAGKGPGHRRYVESEIRALAALESR